MDIIAVLACVLIGYATGSRSCIGAFLKGMFLVFIFGLVIAILPSSKALVEVAVILIGIRLLIRLF